MSIKLLIESAIEQIEREPAQAAAPLERAAVRLADALTEVRRISHRLRPAMLDVLGLPAALEHLGREFGDHSGLAFSMRMRGPSAELPDDVKTVLFRVTQEALTNIEKHAAAQSVRIRLAFRPAACGSPSSTTAAASTSLRCSSTRVAASACATCASAWPRSAARSASARAAA